MAITFDTYKFIETLESAGVPEKQAKAQLEAVSAAISANCDHDQSIKFVEARFEVKTEQVENSLSAKIDKLDAKIDRVDAKIDRVETILNARIDRLDAKIDGVEIALTT